MNSLTASENSFMKVGMLNNKLQLAEFIEWFSKAKGLKSCILEDIVYKRRIHTTMQGILKCENLKDYKSVFHEALARKWKKK
ncbi:hypothetical protein ACFLRZ_04825 [Bacteroidota bacterium]